ncbi:hypothetical protein RB653_000903 [Dictyostelium firmibasis]|uniref:Uncharacterized protein n=1 Tax=Dictyostelium firmibasis TaxID=79012 RepID=A0AAN7YR12_9MYCE
MLTISRGLLSMRKTKQPSVLTKAYSQLLNKDGEIVKTEKSNNESEKENIDRILKEHDRNKQNTEHILFNGSKVNRESYEFSRNDFPASSIPSSEKEAIKRKENNELNREKNIKKAMINSHIIKDPKKKPLIDKFYREYRDKDIEKKIHVELKERENEFVYDEITLDPPKNPKKQIAYLLERIKSDETYIYTDKEYNQVQQLLNHTNLLSKEKIDEINTLAKPEFIRANKLQIAGNMEKSFEIFKKLSNELNHSMSDIFIGNMYFTGVQPKNNNNVDSSSSTSHDNIDDMIPDYDMAFKYFFRAATISKIPVAFGMMGELVYKQLVKEINGGGGIIELDKSDKRLSQAKVFFGIASQLGLKSSTEQLAYLFLNEIRNENAAIEILKRLALKYDDINAISTMGALLLEEHPTVAKDLWLYASKMGDTNAQTNLGRYYYNHKKNPDYNNAHLLWSAASKGGNVDAQFYLGGMYHSGLIVEKNIAKSLQLYEISAKGGNSNAQFLIGRAYIEGDGIEKNLKLGYSYLSKSISQQNETALNYLNELDENEKRQYLNK